MNVNVWGHISKENCPQRKSMRLKGYDYSQGGYYFITICTYNMKYIFGEIIKGKMINNIYGNMIRDSWEDLETRFVNIQLDQFIVMPDHFHGIIIIKNGSSVGVPLAGTQSTIHAKCNGQAQDQPLRSIIPQIIGVFKSITTNRYEKLYDSNIRFNKLWQKSYYDRIIRNEIELNEIREYIMHNPLKWEIGMAKRR